LIRASATSTSAAATYSMGERKTEWAKWARGCRVCERKIIEEHCIVVTTKNGSAFETEWECAGCADDDECINANEEEERGDV